MYLKFLFVIALLLCLPLSYATESASQELFEANCANCHKMDQPVRSGPSVVQLSRMNPNAMLAVLEKGKMRPQAQHLTHDQRLAIVEGITQRQVTTVEFPESAYCKASIAPVDVMSIVHWSGWGGSLGSSGFKSSAASGLKKSDIPKLKLKWAFAFPGASNSRSQPAVLDNTLYIGGQDSRFYALSAESGCIHWMMETDSMVRGAVTVGDPIDDNPVIYFADAAANVYALNASTGELLWKTNAAVHALSGITGTATYHQGRVFVPISSREVGVAADPTHECCVSSGAVVALNANTGERLWQTLSTLVPAKEVGKSKSGKRQFAPSGAPVWSSPTIDAKRGLVYVGTGENYSRPATHTSDAILALDMKTGKLIWSFQNTKNDAWHMGCGRSSFENPCDDTGPDFDFGMSPILATPSDGKQILLAGQKSAHVYALDPDNGGKLLWTTKVGKGSALGGIHWGMATDHKLAFVTNADRDGSQIKEVYKDTELNPGTFALDLNSGEILWQHKSPGYPCKKTKPDERCLSSNSAAPSAITGVVFSGTLDGVLHAFDSITGEVIWQYDTARTFAPVNGVEGFGGSIDGPGPTIANGRIYVNSGYGMFGQKAGNVLLAFEPD